MFSFRESVQAAPTAPVVEVAFTDSTIDLQGLRPGFADLLADLETRLGVPFARLHQVHGSEVRVVTSPVPPGEAPEGDALVTARGGLGLMVRVADCVPVLLADPDSGVVGAAHSGRRGTELDVVARTVDAMRAEGAGRIVAWIGPHVCGRCYEVPEQMRQEVAALVPAAWSETSWGTPALDLGAAVRAQLEALDVAVEAVGTCTLEDPTHHSHRRDGAGAGRFAGLIWVAP